MGRMRNWVEGAIKESGQLSSINKALALRQIICWISGADLAPSCRQADWTWGLVMPAARGTFLPVCRHPLASMVPQAWTRRLNGGTWGIPVLDLVL